MHNMKEIAPRRLGRGVSVLALGVMIGLSSAAQAQISATHIYHNHMPNFWPYYDVSKYDALPVGSPVRPRATPPVSKRGQ